MAAATKMSIKINIDGELVRRLKALHPDENSKSKLIEEAIRFYLNNQIFGVSHEVLSTLESIVRSSQQPLINKIDMLEKAFKESFQLIEEETTPTPKAEDEQQYTKFFNG